MEESKNRGLTSAKFALIVALVAGSLVACNKDLLKNKTDAEESLTKARTASSANDQPISYDGHFLYGSNMGWFNENWSDEDISDILTGDITKGIEGIGVNSLRPALYEGFIYTWGYDVRVNTFNHYVQNGAKDNVVFLGMAYYARGEESNTHPYQDEIRDCVYQSLYEPIWGADGKVNPQNLWAVHCYEVAKRYHQAVKFWEICNEPDFTYNTTAGDGKSGDELNWWDNDPPISDLANWHGPIQSYIRLLRVSYEVIKSVDPEALIATGGIGYRSFLDAILRNTDNPDGGKVTEEYPLKGGAWFDCLSWHVYPVYYLRKWNNSQGAFDHFRHSDAAVDLVRNREGEWQDVLKKYGYGTQYPKKIEIITETNVPGKQVGEWIGGNDVQRNYLIKVAVAAQKMAISGIHVYNIWDKKEQTDDSGGEYDYTGLYKVLPETPSGELRVNESGIAWRTTSRTIGQLDYDEGKTAQLNLPSSIDGGAFSGSEDVYVLWAKTTKDLSEEASATYTFPESMGVTKMAVIEWNGNSYTVEGNTIELTGAPVFIKLNKTGTDPGPEPPTEKIAVESVSISPNTLTRAVGDPAVPLAANISPSNATNKKVTWRSSDPSIATVSASGVVNFIKVGSTYIVVTTEDGNKTSRIRVTVTAPSNIAVTGVSLNKTSLTKTVGDPSETLTANVQPNDAFDKSVSWTSSNSAVATVSQVGVVNFVSEGTATITVTTNDGGKTASCSVTVNAVPTPNDGSIWCLVNGRKTASTSLYWNGFGWKPSVKVEVKFDASKFSKNPTIVAKSGSQTISAKRTYNMWERKYHYYLTIPHPGSTQTKTYTISSEGKSTSLEVKFVRTGGGWGWGR